MREFPPPEGSSNKALFYTLSVAGWIGFVLFLLGIGNTAFDGWIRFCFLVFAIACAVAGSKFYKAGSEADQKEARDTAARASTRQFEVVAKQAEISRRNAELEALLIGELNQVRRQTEIKELETSQAEYQLRQDLIAVGRQQGLHADDVSEVNKTKYLSEISVQEKRAFNQADLDNEVARMREQVRLAIVAKHFSDHQVISLISEQLDALYLQVEDINKSDSIPEGAKRRMIADREEYIFTLKEDKLGRQKRLLEAHNGRDVRGNNEAPLLRGDIEPPVEGHSK